MGCNCSEIIAKVSYCFDFDSDFDLDYRANRVIRRGLPLGGFMCAWHGAQSELLAVAGSYKTSAVTGRKGNANKARAVSRKHEAEPVDVANSEPTIWQRGGGRVCMGVQGLISGEPNRSEVGRDMGRMCVLPREALL